jgi:hypothetical protein
MKWRKLKNWLPQVEGMTHASMPFYFEGDVYFSPRDRLGKSYIYKASFNPVSQKMGLPVEVCAPGIPGEFDDYGSMVSWIHRDGPRVLIYYVGWNIGISVPFRNSVGLIVNGAKGIGPILDRSRFDPIGIGACCRMEWYTSLLGWDIRFGKRQAIYHIVNGHPHSIAITFKNDAEFAIARPCVIQDHVHQPDFKNSGNGSFYDRHLYPPFIYLPNYRMWYSYRGEQYRIGYAESHDGVSWRRMDDEVGIDVGKTGDFDDLAVCYPHVFDCDGQRYMLYNGNNYGKTGFGIAILDS